MILQWIPWLCWIAAGLSLELWGYRDSTGEAWTLSRIMWWLSPRAAWLKYAVAGGMAALWWHWFGD